MLEHWLSIDDKTKFWGQNKKLETEKEKYRKIFHDFNEWKNENKCKFLKQKQI